MESVLRYTEDVDVVFTKNNSPLLTLERGQQGLGRQARPMGQWPQSLNINGPFLKSIGHWSKLMGQSFFY